VHAGRARVFEVTYSAQRTKAPRGIDVALFTTSVQVTYLFQIAEQIGKKDALKAGLENVVKASIGPTTSEVLRSYGLSIDLETSHPKMGFLVKEAAEQSKALLQRNPSRSG
jgi:uroporphyrinogen-III synthase